VVRKSDLIELQKTQRPFGGLAAARWGQLGRVFSSPGPIYEPEGRGADYWRTARALYAAGFRAGDLVHNSFSYHMTPGAWILEAGAQALGCTVFPSRCRPDRAAGGGDGRPAAQRLCRHAVLPAHPAGKGRRTRHQAAIVDQGAGLG
jgi:hypothetical protein